MLSATTKLPGISRVFLRSIAARRVQTQTALKEHGATDDAQLGGSSDMAPDTSTCYSGKNILLTGSSGFCAKPLIERLLSNHPDVQSIYWLTKPINNRNPQELLNDMLNDPLFDSCMAKHGQETLRNKIHTIHGDITQGNFGLKGSDVKVLEETINVVLHSTVTGKTDDSGDHFEVSQIGMW